MLGYPEPEEPPKKEEKKIVHEEIPRMSADELQKFVRELLADKIFVLQFVTPEQRPMLSGSIFLPLALGAFKLYTKKALESLGTVWEYYDKAGPRSVNGFPIFYSCHLMHIDDWKRVAAAYDRERAKPPAHIEI